ncbi:MAG: 1-acyl-sn-glycerol-3-phosphate acyltransferase [Myxococcales bacterium]|nr:1-acyl-sn-glycerol-3-phosphate acyltransferase [Myxococcales bacterium]MDH5308180.1 1-acyl-sn-glycerol-3-phosphate acyltransferase [Myxococcales bacterium]MDH5565295.1 1-acyl-sn-glycerol-3-phosphate acyltransferase [Myxococcales bacterium]
MSQRTTPPLRALWRIARATFAAAVFGALALGLLPLLFGSRWLGSGARRRGGAADLEAQRILHRAAQLYLRIVTAAGIVRVRFVDIDPLQRNGPHLVVANHPSLIDFVVLCSLMPQADCIVNPVRARNAVLRGLVRAAGYVRSDAGPELVRECSERLRSGRSLVVFPEGTRSPVGGLGPFQRGAARIALSVGCDVLPVVIRCDPPALWKRWKWYDLPDDPIHVTVRLREPISAQSIRGSGVSSPLAARRLSAELRESISKGLEEGAGDWARPKHSNKS